ncbi:MAG TPA: hypothetical protein VEI73_06895 [Candidatus Acidoferrum sp.]|nr:hypothetical protein [Candidatus Acidoferrum sp.]
MSETNAPLPAKQTLLLILIPMLFTFAALRLYLHLVHVRHIYPGGYLVHHLFLGVVLALPAAFILAFGPRTRRSKLLAPVALGIGSGMILDEFTYLVMTKASDEDYVSRISFLGAIVCISAAVVLLLLLYVTHRD